MDTYPCAFCGSPAPAEQLAGGRLFCSVSCLKSFKQLPDAQPQIVAMSGFLGLNKSPLVPPTAAQGQADDVKWHGQLLATADYLRQHPELCPRRPAVVERDLTGYEVAAGRAGFRAQATAYFQQRRAAVSLRRQAG